MVKKSRKFFFKVDFFSYFSTILNEEKRIYEQSGGVNERGREVGGGEYLGHQTRRCGIVALYSPRFNPPTPDGPEFVGKRAHPKRGPHYTQTLSFYSFINLSPSITERLRPATSHKCNKNTDFVMQITTVPTRRTSRKCLVNFYIIDGRNLPFVVQTILSGLRFFFLLISTQYF